MSSSDFFMFLKEQMEDWSESLGQDTYDKKHSNQLNSQNEGKRVALIQQFFSRALIICTNIFLVLLRNSIGYMGSEG